MDNQEVGNKRGAQKRIVFSLVLGVFTLLVIVGFLTGFLYAGVKSPHTVVVTQPNVCNDKVIAEFNGVSSQVASSSEDVRRINAEIVQKADQINEYAHADTDPTCLYIALRAAFSDGNKEKSLTYIERLKSLAQEGRFINSGVGGLMSLDAASRYAEGLSEVKSSIDSGQSTGDTLPKKENQ